MILGCWFMGCFHFLCAGWLPLCGLLKGYLKRCLIGTMGKKSGVGNVINNKQWKMRPSACISRWLLKHSFLTWTHS